MIDNSRVVLENNIEYTVIDKIRINEELSYVYLANPKNELDVCVRKEVAGDLDNYLVGLDNKDELEKAIILFIEKNR